MKLSDITQEIKEVAAVLVQKGWAERNAGNFSYRLEDIPNNPNPIKLDIIQPIIPEVVPTFVLTLSISNSNSKFRDIAKDPRSFCGILNIENDNRTYYSADTNAKPSSEAPTHIEIHQYLLENEPIIKAVLHTHPTHLIAFTHKYSKLTKEELFSLLEKTMPEVSMYIPNKVGLVQLLPPGSEELAVATLEELQHHDLIIWKHHGCIAVSDTLWEACDMIDILDKAAQIVLLSG